MSNYRTRDVDRFAAVFKALSNPQRLRIFLRLAERCRPEGRCETRVEEMRCCVGDLGKDLGLAASTVSHHIKELRSSGLMRMERHGRKIWCRVDADHLRSLATFINSTTGGTDGRRER